MANLEEVIIEYDKQQTCWAQSIRLGIDERNLYHNATTLELICDSIREQVTKYLCQSHRHFKVANHYTYRVCVIKRLNSDGEDLLIKSNRTLWLYLEYFTDITDYTKCFDVGIIKLN